MEKLCPGDYLVSTWSGGTTTQLVIFPPEARYADRDFLWRISSATVDLDVSDFTLLPDYERQICTLQGEILLTHNGGPRILLRPYQVHSFSGADQTRSEGRCRDFNLMLRRGKAEGELRQLRVDAPVTVGGGEEADQLLLFCAESVCGVRLLHKSEELQTGESLLLVCEKGKLPALELSPVDPAAPARLILCRMRRI